MKKHRKILKLIVSSSFLSITFGMIVLICMLILFDFFGVVLTKEQIQNNAEYADAYKSAINKYLSDGYVPLQRLLYFHLEDPSLSINILYKMNQNEMQKTAKEINEVCEDQRVKNMTACSENNIEENIDYLLVSNSYFNFPLTKKFIITSFFNEQRIIYDENNVHSGWDFAVPAQTPVYSVCNGVVETIVFTQNENIPYDQSKNKTGNLITIKCDKDYEDTFYVTFAHLYPNSSKVKEGDEVTHWTEIASVGTTGYSTGNHLHYQVENSNREKLDGMKFIDFTMESPI